MDESRHDSGAVGPRPDTAPGHPRAIGPYKLLGVLGEGGMGMVYLAEQASPVRRRVALKVIKPGLDTRQVLARFESERQALAVMDHPNIARVFDGGATEDGRPYFVMELVRGAPLTDYADTHKLSTDERLRLFIDVCRAVQHAHQKGVIHRDLKPANVLVEVSGPDVVVKVIDFGIAKAMGQDLTDRTLVTQFGQLVGTPEYISPEQAEMSGLDVDTRTDIYSLGVMLYELLVGALPYDLTGKPERAIPHSLRERDVPKPSTRLTSLGETQSTIATLRRTTPDFLRRELRGDLDWIILKAMEKDRTRRYETANGLALDIARHLGNEPVLARPPSTGYRMRKFIRRNRVGVLAATVAALALLVGATAAVLGLIEARRERARAEREAATAQRVSDFLVRLFEVNDPGEARGNTITAREILDQGAQRIDTELVDAPLIRARLMRTIGEVYRALGLYADARPLFEKAVQVAEQVRDEGAPELAASLHRLGIIDRQLGDYGGAEAALRRALDLQRALVAVPDSQTASMLRTLAAVHMQQRRFAEADTLLQEVLAIQARTVGEDSPDYATTLNNLGLASFLQGEYAQAEPYLERALDIRERNLGRDHPDLASGFLNLGAARFELSRYADARAAYERALAIYEKALGPEHLNVARALNNLAEVAAVEGDAATAGPLFERALAIKERVLPAGHPDLASTLAGLANVYRETRRFDDAAPLYLRAIEIRRADAGADDERLRRMVEDYATMLRAAGRGGEADALLARSSAGAAGR